jgi:hypothetical protein
VHSLVVIETAVVCTCKKNEKCVNKVYNVAIIIENKNNPDETTSYEPHF